MITTETLDKQIRTTMQWAKSVLSDGGNFVPSLMWFQDDDVRAMAATTLNRDNDDRMKTHAAAKIISGAYVDATALALIIDAYSLRAPSAELLKADGTQWSPGDMQHAFENNTPDKASITECLNMMIADRDGWSGMIQIPYVRTGVDIAFGEPTTAVTNNPAEAMVGPLPEMVQQAITVPSLIDEFHRDTGVVEVLSEESKLAFLTAAIAAVVEMTGIAVGFFPRSQAEEEALTALVERHGAKAGMGVGHNGWEEVQV